MEYSYPPPTHEWDFETFCKRLLRVHWPKSEPQLYGRRGQRQHGVDILDESGVEPLHATQCKFKKPGRLLTEAEIVGEVEKAKTFTPAIGHYFLLTTSERSTDVQRAVVRLNKEHQKHGLFRITLLTWDRIEDILRDNPELWSHAIDPPVKHAIEPIHQAVDAIAQRFDALVPSTVEDQYDAKAVQEAFARHPCSRQLTPEGLAGWQAWAGEHARAFQQASSAVEGRNGYLSQMQHNHRGLPTRRSQVWTVLHNFDGRAADGTTPATRFFRRAFPELFEHVLSQIDALPMPRQRRQAIAASH
jgi:hypothetical protein